MTKRRLSFQSILMAYWLTISAVYYLYVSLTITTQQITLHALLYANPLFTLGILFTSIMMLQAGTLYFVAKCSQSKDGLLGKYLIVLLFQQMMTANLIGAGLIYFYRKQLNNHDENATRTEKGLAYLSSTISIGLSVLVLLLLNRA
ncbi:hypothetical protein A5886_002805 [Enterococcus sp. 8G7_MSG3316]|uniref:Uncharacterized protein n=1 Tax=Candidatus Enterococcus testudinis TaxID=1834191 RepID=A0A242A9J8_9ENTE|nr:hypothetical protein [Enterococcus sp. 8G7_MSG3316]OTN77704.1 hypothetical protein A5886_002805 [Enterococcus sp. 8G7_MSG3316]